jgi:hypothetical protein
MILIQLSGILEIFAHPFIQSHQLYLTIPSFSIFTSKLVSSLPHSSQFLDYLSSKIPSEFGTIK